MTVGTHTVTVTPAGGAAADVSCLVDQVSINHGRSDTGSQPVASTATLDLSYDSTTVAYPTHLDVGATVRVVTTVAGVAHTRFVGQVTDIKVGWDDAGPDTPNAVVAQVVAVGSLADLGRAVVGGVPYPVELDGARVARVLAAAGVTLDPAYSDPGRVQVLARDIDAAAALEVAQETATSAGGLVWQTRAGEVRYADADHRRGTTPAVSLDACDVLVTPTWARDTAGLLNGVVVTYGVAPEDGERPTITRTRPESLTRYGRREASLTTVLAALADAEAMANLLLTRNAFPVWILTDLPVDVSGLDAARTAALLDLELHALVGLTGLPAAGSLPTTTTLWVEGWTETLTWGGHELSLHVSGYCRTVPPPQWDDLPSTLTWDTVQPPGLTWDGATCLGPPTSEGRWSDVPASTRWDTAADTWDTWKG